MTRSLWLAAALLAAAACASLQGGRARAQRLQERLDAFRYDKPLPEVWLEARRLLADRGYPLAGEDAKAVGQKEMAVTERLLSPAKETYPYGEDVGLLQQLGVVGRGHDKGSQAGLSLDTGWRRTRDRYHVDGLQEEGGCRVVFTHVVEDLTDHRGQASRDLELELALAQRIDPAAAARIEGDAGPAETGK